MVEEKKEEEHKPKKKKTKKKVAKNIPSAIAHIQATFNNTIITIRS